MKTLILILISLTSFSQIERVYRFTDTKQVVTLYPSTPMYFWNGDNRDTTEAIIVSASVDSISPNQIVASIFIYYSKPLVMADLVVKFTNGSRVIIKPSITILADNYYEYELSQSKYDLLRTQNVSAIVFGNHIECKTLDKKNFFVQFFNKKYG